MVVLLGDRCWSGRHVRIPRSDGWILLVRFSLKFQRICIEGKMTVNDEPEDPSHAIVFKDDAHIEILENTSFHAYGPDTHHITFIVGGPGVERLYSADVRPDLADGPTADLVNYLLASINTRRSTFLKRFNVVVLP